MKLLVANANTTEAITALCAATARAAAAPGTEIIPATPRFGPAVISTRAENVVAGHALLECLAEHAGQVDAVLLAVSHDTALEAARSLLACPVVGMTEAACLTACLLGGRFGLVTMGMTEPYRERIAQYGLTERLAGLGAIAMTPPEALADPEGAAAQLRAAIAELAGRGADAVVLGGAALAGMLPRVQPGAPVQADTRRRGSWAWVTQSAALSSPAAAHQRGSAAPAPASSTSSMRQGVTRKKACSGKARSSRASATAGKRPSGAPSSQPTPGTAPGAGPSP